MKQNIFFGIKFSSDFSLDIKIQRQLALMLFTSPSTKAVEAKKILKNKKLLSVIENLIEAFQCEIKSINSIDAIEKNDVIDFSEIGKTMSEKLNDWISIFELPTEDELREATNLLKISNSDDWVKSLKIYKYNSLTTPSEIAEYLKLYIIGQDEAVKTLSVLVQEHRERISSSFDLPKSSALFIGSSGTGKSYLINKSREILDVPLIRVSCAELVPSGIVGTTISKTLTTLHLSANGDSQSIIHFDELDKITAHYHKGEEDFKTTIQLEILKLFDNNEKIYFPESHEQYAKLTSINNSRLMLVFSSAFNGIDSFILERLIEEFDGNLKLIDMENIIEYCCSDDIQKYGIIPELAGRLSYICPLRNLNTNDIYNIMTFAKDSEVQKHIKFCEQKGITLRLTDKAIRTLSEKVLQQKLGARSISSILYNLLKDVYFNASVFSGKEYRINEKTVVKYFLTRQYNKIFKSFEENSNLSHIAHTYNINLDKCLDLYSEWKSLKS